MDGSRAVVGLALVIAGFTFAALVLTGHIPPAGATSSSSGTSGSSSEPGDPLRPAGSGGGSKTMR